MEQGKNKVLIVTPFPPKGTGGAETFCEDLAKALSEKYLVHVCTIKWDKPVLWEGMDFKKATCLAYRLSWSLLKMVRKYKYEKVYTLGLIPSFLCYLFGIKYHSVILALYDFKRPGMFTYILNQANKVFVEGNRGEDDMLALNVKPEKIVQFQHWCDQTKFYWVPRNNKCMKVLFVGRAIRIKGKHIIQQCEKLTTGIDYEYVESVPYKDLPKYYQSADVVVVPSLYSEGFSRVIIEAASCGCALVTSNKGSLPEMVGPFGKVIEPTATNFAEVLVSLKRNLLGLEKIQTDTALYALKHFGQKNAEVFL